MTTAAVLVTHGVCVLLMWPGGLKWVILFTLRGRLSGRSGRKRKRNMLDITHTETRIVMVRRRATGG